MNVENIKAVRDLIASLPPERVDMSNFSRFVGGNGFGTDDLEALDKCGTAGCICGWAAHLMHKRGHLLDGLGDEVAVADWLGLPNLRASFETEGNLFYPPRFMDGIYTQADAIATLDRLIKTGQVKWPRKKGVAQ